MTEVQIKDEDLAGLKDKVVVLTGCSSGIGLATAKLLLELGSKVVGGDLNASPIEHPDFTFVKTNVTAWTDLLALFKAATTKHGQVDHVYANAGIGGIANYLEERLDSSGNLLEPNHLVFDINLRSVVNTSYLAIQHLRKNPTGGSIVLIGSASSFQRFRVADYVAAKHGVLGLMRGLVPVLAEFKPVIRVNTIAPSWTVTGLVPEKAVEAVGKRTQGPEVVARKVAILMADESRNCQLLYSYEGRVKEIESVLEKAADEILDGDIGDDMVVQRLYEMFAQEKPTEEAKTT